MTKRYQLDIPEHLTRRETEATIEVLEDVLDLLCRHLARLHHHTRPEPDGWKDPPWLDDEDDA